MPRTGIDIEGNPFPDRQGTLLDELNWLRSWSNETYLWNDEILDQDPGGFATPEDYFAVLKTNDVTPSGEDKDDFHFFEPTEDFLEARNSVASAGYGASFSILNSTVPRDVRVRYTDPDTPASNTNGGLAPFLRGARILQVDGVDLVNDGTSDGVDTINAGLFPATAGEQHTFLVEDLGGTRRTVTLTSANVSRAPVNTTAIINQGADRVGYIAFNTFGPFSSEEAIASAISEMDAAGVSDLVLDLRYNGGGLLAVAGQLGYMIAGDAATNGRTFELLRFNDDAGNFNPVTGEFNEPIPFYSTGVGFSLASGTPLDTLNLNRVFILSTGGTCSASEAVINGLRGVDIEVILIGDTTCGKPFGFYPTDNCGTTWYTIQFQGVNDKGFGDFADGFVPDNSNFQFGVRLNGCVVEDDLAAPLGDPNEALLSAALQYRADGTCPAPPPVSVSEAGASAESQSAVVADTRLSIDGVERRPSELGRDLTMPF